MCEGAVQQGKLSMLCGRLTLHNKLALRRSGYFERECDPEQSGRRTHWAGRVPLSRLPATDRLARLMYDHEAGSVPAWTRHWSGQRPEMRTQRQTV